MAASSFLPGFQNISQQVLPEHTADVLQLGEHKKCDKRGKEHHLHSQHKDKLGQVQFSWSGIWPEFPTRCPNVGTNSCVVFVVHPNQRWSPYVPGYVHTTIWPSSLTGSRLELAGGHITWSSYLALGPVFLPQNSFYYRSQRARTSTLRHGPRCAVFLEGVRPSNWGVLGVSLPTGDPFNKPVALWFDFGHEQMEDVG